MRLRLEHIYVSIWHVCCVFSSSFELHNHCCEINFIKTLLSIRILFILFYRQRLVWSWHQQRNGGRQFGSMRLGAANHQNQCSASGLWSGLHDFVRWRNDQKSWIQRRTTGTTNAIDGPWHGTTNDVKERMSVLSSSLPFNFLFITQHTQKCFIKIKFITMFCTHFSVAVGGNERIFWK